MCAVTAAPFTLQMNHRPVCKQMQAKDECKNNEDKNKRQKEKKIK